ncbi:unnamed protein product [Brassica rapa subsp. narinosa]|uniref:(rape) hypothetical protein n=1 Tax=Brassica napus TaxID=3708 RepID=A0A816P329_BRANA|nr:unnamed protein product [Brassica napus]
MCIFFSHSDVDLSRLIWILVAVFLWVFGSGAICFCRQLLLFSIGISIVNKF